MKAKRVKTISVGKKGVAAFVLLFVLLFLPSSSYSETFEVGPGKRFESIGDVPWESLSAGDEVLIYWRAQPYKEKWVIAVQGSEAKPFVVRGIPGEDGTLPVVDGREAVTRKEINFWNENRGVVKIGGANLPAVDVPTWIIVENLDIRSGRTPYLFTGRSGLAAYSRNAASVYVENGQNVTIRNCILRDSGNGLFVSHASRNIVVEGCWILENGIENSIYEHNAYTEALGMVYQYNRFGPLRFNCLGNNLKDRSAGTVVRYNWIEGGNRQLDLVDAEDSQDLVNHPSYRSTFVYGNILIEPDGAGNSQIIHYGGDSGNTSLYRKGMLHFFNNTVVSSRLNNTTLMRLSTNEETCDCRNNVVYVTGVGTSLALLDSAGFLRIRNNWLKSGWRTSHSGLTGIVENGGGTVIGDKPGFVDETGQDFRPAPSSPCVNAGTLLHPDTSPFHLLALQYVKHRAFKKRPTDGRTDIGAFEFEAPSPRGLRISR